ncbi:MAG: STAS domain-containing protein [bacterium]|nr:STAS domain-containing protein [bacterium]
MKIKIEKTAGSAIIIHLEGRFDPQYSEKVEERIVKLIHNGSNQIFVDCENVQYIGSTGIKILLLMNEKLKKLNGWLKIISLPETGRKILDTMGLLDRFDIYKDRTEALKGLI